MVEDKAFNAFLKAKLEEDIVVPRVAATPRRSLWLRRPYLMAASLAAVCALATAPFVNSFDSTRINHATAAIQFLEAYEGATSTVTGEDTFAATLLAWQDAPYNEIGE